MRVPFRITFLSVFAACAVFSSTALASTYYVRAGGNDKATGTSVDAAWASPERVNSAALAPGDVVLFEGGAVFTGPLLVTETFSGTVDQPVTFASFGDGRATIDAGPKQGDAISVKNVSPNQFPSNLVFQGLNLTGAGLLTGKPSGAVGLRLSNARSIQIDRVEASGFQWAGIEVSGSRDVTMTNVNAHNNGYAGISSDGGYIRNTSGGRSYNLTIRDCQTDDNSGNPYFPKSAGGSYNGNGIVLFGVSGATVQYCEAGRNGTASPSTGPGGPVGIWAAHADHVLIEHSISHDNDSGVGTDGGGFDFDGGTSDSTIQYSYAYNNASIGFYLYEYGAGEKWDNNAIRYNISVNNARKYDKVEFDSSYSGNASFSRAYIHHNFFYNDDPGAGVIGGEDLRPDSSSFYDNVIVGASSGQLLLGASFPSRFGQLGGSRYAGNAYATLDGSSGIGPYADLASFRDGTGQELFQGQPVGIEGVDFKLRGKLGPAPQIIDPHRLDELAAYAIVPGSPLASAGIDVASAGLEAATLDFFGAAAAPNAVGPSAGRTTVTPAPNLVANGGFEAGLGQFSSLGASVVAGEGLSGSKAAVISGPFGGVWRTLTNLKANTTYEVSVYLRSNTPESGAHVYAKEYDGADSLVEGEIMNTRAFTRSAVRFRTGPTQTTAEVGVFKNSGNNDGIADDLVVRKVAN